MLYTLIVFIELENSEKSLNVKANGSFYIFSPVFVVWLGSKGNVRKPPKSPDVCAFYNFLGENDFKLEKFLSGTPETFEPFYGNFV